MNIEIIGSQQKISRFVTGLHTFDYAFKNAQGDIGFPIGKSMEIYGNTHSGKSTICYSLAGRLSNNIALGDVEGFDPDYLLNILKFQNFSGQVHLANTDSDEKMLGHLLELGSDSCDTLILDSIGGISPINELEGKIGDANMGHRAKIVSQFIRRHSHLTRKHLVNLFATNHIHSNMGFAGTHTTGGETVKYEMTLRIKIKVKEEFKDDGSYVVEGLVVKNRWGFKGRKFYLFIKAGVGIHTGLTALYDGFAMGAVTRSKTVKIEDASYGYLKKIIENEWENAEFFQPFINVLQGDAYVY